MLVKMLQNTSNSFWRKRKTIGIGEISERSRFPQSRMGVEQVYEDYFHKSYRIQNEWEHTKGKGKIKMPRFDIEMEVLGEKPNNVSSLCHSYVQSGNQHVNEISRCYGFKIQTFTHILEGYKLADKMSAHGVVGSTFADWWAYKYEVNDAIPYNAAIMMK